MKDNDQQLIWEAYGNQWPMMTILNGIAQGKSPIVIQADKETFDGIRNKLGITESVDVIEEAHPAVIAAVSVGILGAAAVALVVYAIKKAIENGYEVETHGELPGGTGGSIILTKRRQLANN